MHDGAPPESSLYLIYSQRNQSDGIYTFEDSESDSCIRSYQSSIGPLDQSYHPKGLLLEPSKEHPTKEDEEAGGQSSYQFELDEGRMRPILSNVKDMSHEESQSGCGGRRFETIR